MSALTPREQRLGALLEQHARRAVPNDPPRPPRAKGPEAVLLAAVLAALNDLPWCWAGRLTRGVAKVGGRVIRYGLADGASDVLAIVAPSGRAVWLECKADGGRVQRNQQWFLDKMAAYGSYAVVVRSVDEAIAAVIAARDGRAA